MRFISLLTAAALLSTSHVSASPVPVPTMTNTGPLAGPFTNAFNFCEDLNKKYGTQMTSTSMAMKRDAEPFIIDLGDLGDLEKRDVDKRASLSPALPLGRTYDVAPNSKGTLYNGAAAFYNIGNPVGPCIVFSFGNSYFNALVVTADPFRVLYPAKLAGNNFNTGVKICQAMCDGFLRFQSLWSGGSTTCQSINPWQSSPPDGDPFKPLGDFYICDLYPYKITSDYHVPPYSIKNSLIANARSGLLGREDAEN